MLADHIRDILEGKRATESLNVSEVYAHISESWELLKSVVRGLDVEEVGEVVLCCAGFVVEDDVAVDPGVVFVGTKRIIHWDTRGHEIENECIEYDGNECGDIYVYADSDFISINTATLTIMFHPHILTPTLPDEASPPPPLQPPNIVREDAAKILTSVKTMHFLRFDLSSSKEHEAFSALIKGKELHRYIVEQEVLRKKAEERRLSRVGIPLSIPSGQDSKEIVSDQMYHSDGIVDVSGAEDDRSVNDLQGAPQQNSPIQNGRNNFPAAPNVHQYVMLHRSVSEHSNVDQDPHTHIPRENSFTSNSGFATIGDRPVQSMTWKKRVDRVKMLVANNEIPSISKGVHISFLHASCYLSRKEKQEEQRILDGCLLFANQELSFVSLDSSVLFRYKATAVVEITQYHDSELVKFNCGAVTELVMLCTITTGVVRTLIDLITKIKPVRVITAKVEEVTFGRPWLQSVVDHAEHISVKERERKVRFNREAEVRHSNDMTGNEIAIAPTATRRSLDTSPSPEARIHSTSPTSALPPIHPPPQALSDKEDEDFDGQNAPYSSPSPASFRQATNDSFVSYIEGEDDDEEEEEEESDDNSRPVRRRNSGKAYYQRRVRNRRPSFDDAAGDTTEDDEEEQRPGSVVTFESPVRSESPASRDLASASPLITRKLMKRRNSQETKQKLQPLVRENPEWGAGGGHSITLTEPTEGPSEDEPRKKSAEMLDEYIFPARAMGAKKLSDISLLSSAGESETDRDGMEFGSTYREGSTIVIRASDASNSPTSDAMQSPHLFGESASPPRGDTYTANLVDSILEKDFVGALAESLDEDEDPDPTVPNLVNDMTIFTADDPALCSYVATLFAPKAAQSGSFHLSTEGLYEDWYEEKEKVDRDYTALSSALLRGNNYTASPEKPPRTRILKVFEWKDTKPIENVLTHSEATDTEDLGLKGSPRRVTPMVGPSSPTGASSTCSSAANESFDIPRLFLQQDPHHQLLMLSWKMDRSNLEGEETTHRAEVTAEEAEETQRLFSAMLAFVLSCSTTPPTADRLTSPIPSPRYFLHSNEATQTDATIANTCATSPMTPLLSPAATPRSIASHRSSPEEGMMYGEALFSPAQKKDLDAMVRRTHEVLQMGTEHADSLMGLFLSMRQGVGSAVHPTLPSTTPPRSPFSSHLSVASDVAVSEGGADESASLAATTPQTSRSGSGTSLLDALINGDEESGGYASASVSASAAASPEAERRLRELQLKRQRLENEVMLKKQSQSPERGKRSVPDAVLNIGVERIEEEKLKARAASPERKNGRETATGGASPFPLERPSKKDDLQKTLMDMQKRRRNIEQRLAANHIHTDLSARELARGFADAAVPVQSSPDRNPSIQ